MIVRQASAMLPMHLVGKSSLKALWLKHSNSNRNQVANIPKFFARRCQRCRRYLAKTRKPNEKSLGVVPSQWSPLPSTTSPDMSDKPKIDEDFNKEHEVTQHEVAVELAKEVQANKFDIIDGEADIDEEVVERKVMDALVAKQDRLRVQIF